MFFGTLTIANDGFSMVFGSPNHWFQWFSMVKDHWSNDGMVSMDRTGLNEDEDNYLMRSLKVEFRWLPDVLIAASE